MILFRWVAIGILALRLVLTPTILAQCPHLTEANCALAAHVSTRNEEVGFLNFLIARKWGNHTNYFGTIVWRDGAGHVQTAHRRKAIDGPTYRPEESLINTCDRRDCRISPV